MDTAATAPAFLYRFVVIIKTICLFFIVTCLIPGRAPLPNSCKSLAEKFNLNSFMLITVLAFGESSHILWTPRLTKSVDKHLPSCGKLLNVFLLFLRLTF